MNGFSVSNNGGIGTYNTYSAANYDTAGNNLLGGTNRVQFSFSDYKTMDYSVAGTSSVFAGPGAAGYGTGNPAIPAASGNLLGIGVNGAREAYQSGVIANMPTTNIDPATISTGNPNGSSYADGPWKNAGLDNLSSNVVAANAVLIAANPGTGLSRLNKGDAQWIQTTGRLGNGLQFDTVTRDADLGQRPTFAAATGIDGTWAVGVNDGGDSTTTANANLQHTIGSMKFSGKSADSEVYNTIIQSRMGAGVLALTSTIGATATGPIRSLDIDFNDLTDPQLAGGATNDSQFISANLNTISTYQYQAVLLGYTTTVKEPNSAALLAQEHADGYLTGNNNPSDATNKSLISESIQDAEWAKMNSFNTSNPSDPTATGIKGDTTGDVAKFLNNLLNSQGTYATLTTANDPADAFLSNSYLTPNLLQNQRDPATGVITPNPNYDASAFAKAQAIYDNGTTSKFNANKSNSFGKDTETTGVGSNYGAAISGGQSPATFNGNIPITALNANGSVAGDAVLAPGGNWLFGNFNQNGVRDLSAVESGLAAAKALYNVEPAGTTGANSAFLVSSGTANAVNSTPVTYTDVNGVPHRMTKGDIIVLGDFQSTGKFDGANLVALARGAAASDASGTGYTAGTISGGQANFADTVRNALLRKNDAMNYMQSNTADASFDGNGHALNGSAFLRLSGRGVLTMPGVTTAATVPTGAIALNTTDPNSGLEQFTYDSNGSYTFDKHDVNRDGVVDFNDAILVDNFNGQSYSNLTQQLAATEQTPVTGTIQSISLTYVQQIDGESTIGAADLAELNTGLTGVGNTNWYGYGLTKSGPGIITFARTAGTVTVYSGASFQISSGTVHVASAIDPFTDSSATGLDTSKSTAATISAAALNYDAGTTGIKVYRLGSLTIQNGGVVSLNSAANHANHSLLVTGNNLTFTGTGTLDVGANDLVVHNGTLSTVVSQLKAGLNSNVGYWNGTGGIVSTQAAADTRHLTTLGYRQSDGSAFDTFNTGTNDVLVKYTYYGDADLNGIINGADYAQIDNGFGSHASGWFNGDFNYDGVVDGTDYSLIDNTFNQISSTGASSLAIVAQPTTLIGGLATSSVPEPFSFTAMGIATGYMLCVRRRRLS
jgi:hypothetical protein